MFSEPEDLIIRRFKLYGHTAIERKPTIEYFEEGYEDSKGRTKTRKVKRELDNNIYLREFYRRTPRWQFPTPAAAKHFEQELRDAFQKLKEFLTTNGAPPVPVIFDA